MNQNFMVTGAGKADNPAPLSSYEANSFSLVIKFKYDTHLSYLM